MPKDEPNARAFRYEFDGERAQVLLGRRGGVDVLLPHPRVALVHARIERRGGSYYLVDEGSAEGTTLNGTPAPAGQRLLLHDRDQLGIGGFLLEVSVLATELEGPEGSAIVARRMVRHVLERVGRAGSQPELRVSNGAQVGLVLSLDDPGRTYILGQGAAAGGLQLDDVDMWSDHAALERDSDGVTVRALGATQALTVNGERVVGDRRLHSGDVLGLGAVTLTFSDPGETYLRRLSGAGAAAGPAVTAGSAAAAGAASAGAAFVPSTKRGADRRLEWGLLGLGAITALGAAIALILVLAW
jgi:pSer/pThr/pTyr-binding forkhead associated (FHA) protein